MIKTTFAFLMMTTAIGCSFTQPVSLDYSRPPILGSGSGEIAVVVEDKRPPKRGGDTKIPGEVGLLRNTFGMPIASQVSLKPPTEAMKDLITDCLRGAGYSVVNADGRVPTVHAQIEELWSDGYIHYEMSLQLAVQMNNWRFPLEIKSQVTLQLSAAELNSAYTQLMNEAAQKLVEQFKSDRFKKGYAQASLSGRAVASDN
jgi:hypothetical protein